MSQFQECYRYAALGERSVKHLQTGSFGYPFGGTASGLTAAVAAKCESQVEITYWEASARVTCYSTTVQNDN